MLGNLIFKLSSFFYVILIARIASQDDVGLFYLSLAIVSIVEIFSNAGIPLSLQRYVPFFEGKKEYNKILQLLKISYFLVIVSGIAFIVLTILFSDYLGSLYNSPSLSYVIQIFSIYIILNAIFRLNYTYLQSRTDIKGMQYLSNIQNISKLIITFGLFIYFGSSVTILVAGFILSLVFGLIASIPLMKQKIVDLPKSFETIDSWMLIREIAPFGMMLTTITMLWVIIGASDRILVGYLLPNSTEAVAIYSIASTFSAVLMVIPIAIANIFLPIISKLEAQNDRKSMIAITESASRWSMYFTFPAAIIMITFAAPMLFIFYGEEYAAGGYVMAILTLAFLFQSFSFMLSNLLAAIRMVKIELKIAFAVAFLNIFLNIILIPYFNMEGAAIATLICSILLFLLLVIYSKKILEFNFSNEFLRLSLSGFLALITFLCFSIFFPIIIPSIGPLEYLFITTKIIYLCFLGFYALVAIIFFLTYSILIKAINLNDLNMLKSGLLKYHAPKKLVNVIEKILFLGVK